MYYSLASVQRPAVHINLDRVRVVDAQDQLLRSLARLFVVKWPLQYGPQQSGVLIMALDFTIDQSNTDA